MESKEKFLEKARTWPRVETADQLAGLLSGVKPRRWLDYTYVANPPCHQSSSGESLSFGDAPGGGLVVYCWACEGETVERVENALGIALQVQRQGGGLRYRDGGQRGVRRELGATPKSPTQAHQPLHATALGEGITLGDFFSSPFWLLSAGKGKPATARGGRAAWRQSRDTDRGGILLARFGGVSQEVTGDGRRYRIQILPWDTYAGIVAKANDPALRVVEGAEPMVSLAGDQQTPCPGDFLLFDMDYKPGQDPASVSAPVRDTVAQRLSDAGASLFRSRGGHGFHAVLRLAAEDIEAGRQPRRKHVDPDGVPGLSFDIFLPGSKSPLNLSRERPMANTGAAHVLPVLTLAELDGVVRGQGRSEVNRLLDEAARHSEEPEYAVLLVQAAEGLAAEGLATEAERERLDKAKRHFGGL